MASFAKRVRNAVAGVAVKRFPSLLYQLADKNKRAGLRVRAEPGWIDIVHDREQRAIRLSRTNAVYVPDMVNSFEYYFGSAEPIRVRIGGKPHAVVDFSTPRFQRVCGFDDFPVMCPSLTEPIVTARQYLDFAQLGSGHVVLDLGCYSGLTSIMFSRAVGSSGRVVAIEPDPVNFTACRTNLAQHARSNALDNVTLINAAAAGERGTMAFSSEGAMGSAAAAIVGNYRGEMVQVECLNLQQMAETARLSRVDFVKMDIEGSEESVLRAAEPFFRRFEPRIIVEPHLVAGELSEHGVRRILESYGYRCSTIEQTGVSLPLVTGVMER
jgi:methyltransferase, FkbM family